jgi:hypothetical protein
VAGGAAAGASAGGGADSASGGGAEGGGGGGATVSAVAGGGCCAEDAPHPTSATSVSELSRAITFFMASKRKHSNVIGHSAPRAAPGVFGSGGRNFL